MTEPHLSAGAALAGAVGGAVATAWADQVALAFFGVPLAAVTAAMTGALVPALLLDSQPLLQALRQWTGSVALALITTALVLLTFGLPKEYAIGVAGLTAAFARDLFAALRGELPPLITAVRERLAGRAKSSDSSNRSQ